MSAYEEFSRERRAIDSLIADGYVIVGSSEALEGMLLRFKKTAVGSEGASASDGAGSSKEPGAPSAISAHDADPVALLLLTADARKYASNLILSQLSNQA
ncbi:hypothetical protein ACFPPD_15550 [Cohnella suwonensis]|uniref:General stress protein 17M-like domain-containing protein n=1 Tax=Cohnella suwonensis TaxID=696072 RepID=A0ABW0LZU5_9BACL